MDFTVLNAVARISDLDAQPYDGIAGSLPDWVPQPLNQQFRLIRLKLLDKYSIDQVRQWYADHREATRPKTDTDYVRTPAIPPKIWRELSELAYIEDLVKLGKGGAYEAYLGKSAFESTRSDAIKERNRTLSLQAAKKQVEVRREKNVERDRRIHDAHRSGKKPKQIAGAEGMSASQVNRVLRRFDNER